MSKRTKKTNSKVLNEILAEQAVVALGGMGGLPGHVSRIENQLAGLSHVDKTRILEGWMKHVNKGIDISYIRAVLFPENNPYDIPQPMSNLSYARFHDKDNLTISTGPMGSGMLVWYPRVTVGPSLFVMYPQTSSDSLPTVYNTPAFSYDQLVVDALGTTKKVSYLKTTCKTTSSAAPMIQPNMWRTGLPFNYADLYSQSALVAASIQLQYTGAVEQESGIMVGGHIYGQGLDNISTDSIENSQYVTRARPSEGLRFVYLPMEGTDYEYYPNSNNNSHNAGAQPLGDEQKFYLYWPTSQPATSPTLGTDRTWLMNVDGTYATKSTQFASIDENIVYHSNTHYIAAYWMGLPKNENWLRLDTTRRFNGIPRVDKRREAEVSRQVKNFDPKATFDALRQICVNAPVGGHTLKELDRTQDRIQEQLPNIISDGVLDRVDGLQTLSEVAGVLEQPNVLQKNLMGATGSMMGRAYPYG